MNSKTAFKVLYGAKYDGDFRDGIYKIFAAGWNARQKLLDGNLISDGEIRARVREASYHGRWMQIAAIKKHRELTGSDLDEAKKYVDTECADLMEVTSK